MALPPNIPTSFVPHSASTAPRRYRFDLTNAFNFVSYIVFCIVLALALGVFFYGRILSARQSSKDAELAQAEAAIDPATAEGFVRLRDRLASGATLLANHTAFSGFFTSLGTLMPTTVRFTSLHLSFDNKGAVKLDGAGVAKSFNALAAASAAFARGGRMKDAIFSNIIVNASNNSVSFILSATLDPKLIAFSPSIVSASKATATSTPTP